MAKASDHQYGSADYASRLVTACRSSRNTLQACCCGMAVWAVFLMVATVVS